MHDCGYVFHVLDARWRAFEVLASDRQLEAKFKQGNRQTATYSQTAWRDVTWRDGLLNEIRHNSHRLHSFSWNRSLTSMIRSCDKASFVHHQKSRDDDGWVGSNVVEALGNRSLSRAFWRASRPTDSLSFQRQNSNSRRCSAHDDGVKWRHC